MTNFAKRSPSGGAKRFRGRGNNNRRGYGNKGGNTQQFDRRARHNAQKAVEKYENMAKDALRNGEVIDAEYYFQHMDHYQRVINECDAIANANQAAQEAENTARETEDTQPENQEAANSEQSETAAPSEPKQRRSRNTKATSDKAEKQEADLDIPFLKRDIAENADMSEKSETEDVKPAPKRRGRPKKQAVAADTPEEATLPL